MEHVEDLIASTAFPERPSNPADEAAIERLFTAAQGSESEMARLLLAEEAGGRPLAPGR
jgi:hypothetical protein